MKLNLLALGFALAILLTGCETVPETGRSQLNIVSASEEMKMGLAGFNEIKGKTPISKDAAANTMLQRVGQRIAAVAKLPDAQWEFVLFESPEVNAFCLPGGKVGVYTGLLPITKNEAGLATVVGHEVAHATARHGAERMSQATAMDVGGQIASSVIGSTRYSSWNPYAMAAYGVVGKVGVELPYSRKHETEADYIGLLYMARAGYDPEEAVAFWQRFSDFNKKSGSAGLSFLRTHPLDDKRIADLQASMPKAKAEYHPAK